jgi:hypothetical protein
VTAPHLRWLIQPPATASSDRVYVEVTSLVSDDVLYRDAPARPTLTVETMLAATTELLSVRRDDLTDEGRRQLDARVEALLGPAVPKPSANEVEITNVMRHRAENTARGLGFTPVSSGSRITADDPICAAARGWAIGPTPYERFAQGYTLATWEPVTYPENGDWTWGPGMAEWLDYYDTDVRPRDIPERLTLTDPLADLKLWVGVTTERTYLDQMLAGPDGRPDPWMAHIAMPLALERLQHRRDSQAAGRPLWEADLRPPDLRDGHWTMFVCYATDTARIPAENLQALASRSARVAAGQ